MGREGTFPDLGAGVSLLGVVFLLDVPRVSARDSAQRVTVRSALSSGLRALALPTINQFNLPPSYFFNNNNFLFLSSIIFLLL